MINYDAELTKSVESYVHISNAFYRAFYGFTRRGRRFWLVKPAKCHYWRIAIEDLEPHRKCSYSAAIQFLSHH